MIISRVIKGANCTLISHNVCLMVAYELAKAEATRHNRFISFFVDMFLFIRRRVVYARFIINILSRSNLILRLIVLV